MTVADVLNRLPLPYDEAVTYGLVFAADLAQRLAEVQAEHPSQHMAVPRQLTDGRFLLCGDLLSEVPAGLYASGFSHLDPGRFNEIEMIPWAEAVAMLPPDDPIG
jgi:hypothetical protein